MLCRRKLSARRRRVRRYICVVLAVILLFLVYFEVAVKVQLTDVIRTELCTAAQQSLNRAVADFLEDHGDVGERLTQLRFGEGGAVAAVTTDPAYINFVKADIGERAQALIDALTRDQGISIPIGSFTGLVFLNSFGPEISLSVESRQTVSCTFMSTFESAGINQTLHHIALNVEVSITVYHPFRIYRPVKITSDYEIAQTVIVGSVPSYGGVVTY